MSLPRYIRTEWKGRGHVILTFRNSNCKLCEEPQKAKNKESALIQSSSIRNECSHTNDVECLLSTFNCWEFEEELNEEETTSLNDTNLSDSVGSTIAVEETLPPTISKETWKMWQHYWNNWKDVCLNLSWVKRFKNLCDSDTIQWYENYCDSYPQMLSYVSYCDDIELEKEKNIAQLDSSAEESNGRKVADELYEEFSSKRYWVHFRLFLRDSNIELKEELKSFFLSHGIHEEPLKNSLDEIHEEPPQNSLTGIHEEQPQNSVDGIHEEQPQNSVPVDGIHEEQPQNSVDGIHEEQPQNSEDGIHKEQPQKSLDEFQEEPPQNSRDGTHKEPPPNSLENCEPSTNSIDDEQSSESKWARNPETNRACSTESKNDLSVLNEADSISLEHSTSEASQPAESECDKSEEATHPISDSILMVKQKNEANSGNLIADHETYEHDSPLVEDRKETKRRKSTKSKDRACGVAWALKHIKRLGEEAKISQPENSNHTFVFGSSATSPRESEPLPPKPTDESCHSHSSLPDTVRTNVKRKHEVLESDNIESDFTHKQNDNHAVVKSPGGFIVRAIGGVLIHFQHLVSWFSNGLFRFIMGIVSINPFQKTLWWNRKGKEELSKESKMKRTERTLIRTLRNMFKPTIRRVPDSSILSSEGVYLTELIQCDDIRDVKENLIKVSQLDNSSQTSESDLQSGLYVLYMAEEDIDEALEDMVELFPVAAKEEPLHRTVTIFDESGMPQDVIKVPVDDGKMRRCMLEDDFKNNSGSENITDSNLDVKEVRYDEHWLDDSPDVYFDEEGNPVATPASHTNRKTKDSLHLKMNRVLQNSRLMRLSKDDVHNAPDDVADDIMKYWHQRFRLFLRYDEGIKLDHESWFSVTPEMIAAHQAERCACDTAIDAFCGAGGNAIQLAATCNSVIAIDIDPKKLAIAKHNAKIYGVDDRIEFIQGDFFQLVPQLKADVVYLAPPWGGVDYLKEPLYDIFSLDGQLDAKKIFQAAREITHDIALYLPKSSNLFQIIELASLGGKVDVEFSHMSNKRKGLTAYFGDLANCVATEEYF